MEEDIQVVDISQVYVDMMVSPFIAIFVVILPTTVGRTVKSGF